MLAGACADNDRGGGGGSAFCSGYGGEGGRASLREGLPVCVTHVPSPAAGGGARAPVRDGGGMGGGREGPPVRGPAGAPAPFASSLLSPATGEGATSCAKSRVGGVVGEGNMYGLFPCVPGSPVFGSARAALRTPVAGSGDLVARGSARGPAGVASSARVACPTGAGSEHGFRDPLLE